MSISGELYKSVQHFFNSEEWENMSDFEKIRCVNLRRNYELLKSSGFKPPLPHFMMPKRNQDIKRSSHLKRNAAEKIISKGPKLKYFAVESNSKSKRTKRNKGKEDTNPMHAPHDVSSKLDIRLSFGEMMLGRLVLHAKHLKKDAFSVDDAPEVDEELDEEPDSKPERRYPKRSVSKKCYTEEELPSEDEFLFCDECGQEYEGACHKHGPMLLVCDEKAPRNAPDRASRTLPCFLSLGISGIRNAGIGVWTEVTLPKGIVFGPYRGTPSRNLREAEKSGYAWLIRKSGKAHHFVEGVEERLSNWLRFVNCADFEEKQNLIAFQYKKKIFYRTYKPVLEYTELLVWYGPSYARYLGIDVKLTALPAITSEIKCHKCRRCDLSFSSENFLEKHMLWKHSEIRGRHTCHLCGYSTNREYNFKHHLRTHTEEKQYVCEKCGKAFTTMAHCKTHQMVHTGERSHVCKICGKEFNKSFNLQRHIRYHTGERPFCCPICGKCFNESGNLKSHKFIHIGQKPYKCELCEYRSKHKSNFRRHFAARHKYSPTPALTVGKDSFH